MKKLHTVHEDVHNFIDAWGPVPPERYNGNYLSFLTQSPKKAYVFWEWAGGGYKEFGVVLDKRSLGHRALLARGLASAGEYWIEVEPDQEYAVELIGWNDSGAVIPLMRSRTLRTPRMGPSPNKEAIFIDVRTRRRFSMAGFHSWDDLMGLLKMGGSRAWSWFSSGAVSSGGSLIR
jgi:hypothetical protein